MSMRRYAMCDSPDKSISYAESSGSLPSGWLQGESLVGEPEFYYRRFPRENNASCFVAANQK